MTASGGQRLHVELRCEIAQHIGVGHAARCVTLAVALAAAGHDAEIVSPRLPRWLQGRLDRAGVASNRTSSRTPALLVVDGYGLGDEVRQATSHGTPTLLIDDNRELPADLATLVLNPNPHAAVEMYGDLDVSRLLLGTRYALVREDVVAVGPRSVDVDGTVEVPTVVAIGGTDPLGLTLPTVRHVLAAGGRAIVSAAGPVADVNALAADPSVTVDPGDLVEAYRRADLAVVGGGGTMWEVACLGIPAIAAIVADNQAGGATTAGELGLVVPVDVRADDGVDRLSAAIAALMADTARRREMHQRGPQVIDGRGPSRVVDAVERLLFER
ncbi:MAG: hypothetical protein AAFY28_02790 [Actinomycetota bacterium]